MPLLPDAEPFESAGAADDPRGRVGVLLQHGFTGSPASMKPWARHLADQGYAVSVPLLPGHGTRWQDLNARTWSDWYAETTRAFEELRARTDQVVVAGLSMGGALVLRLAADRPDEVAGVVLVNAAVHSERKDVKLLPVVKHLVPSFPGIANDIKAPGVSELGYTRTPLRAADSMFRGFAALREDLGRVTAPLLFFRSRVDHVVDPSSGRIVLARVGSTDVRERILEESFHVATLDHDAPAIFSESEEFVARVSGLARTAPDHS